MFKPLSHFQKFQPGSYLWLIFFEPKRDLFKYINWRTGFLLQKPKSEKSISQAVLVDTQNIFPNNSLLCLPLKEESWFSDVYKYWKQMNKPSFRVFLPLDYDEEKLNQYWSSSDKVHSLFYYKEARK